MASFATLAEKIDKLVQEAITSKIFSACSVAVAQGDEQLIRHFGSTSWQQGSPVTDNTYFDLASLSKPLATSLAVFSLIEEGTVHLDDTLADLLTAEVPADKAAISLFELLNHCSGLPAHRHFYKIVEDLPLAQRQTEMARLVLAEALEYQPGSRAIYSDLGFILLGTIVEQKSGHSLADMVARIYQPLGLESELIYNPLDQGLTDFASTEQCPWRHRLLTGEVDDQNTWIVGGVSGQAGLFGRAADVLKLLRKLTRIACGEERHPLLGRELLKKAMQPQGPVKGSCWGLGFDTPSPAGSSAGHLISTQSCGHLGFTGTSFWHDFERDISVVLLTNRIHPRADNDRIKAFRPAFHDLVFATLS